MHVCVFLKKPVACRCPVLVCCLNLYCSLLIMVVISLHDFVIGIAYIRVYAVKLCQSGPVNIICAYVSCNPFLPVRDFLKLQNHEAVAVELPCLYAKRFC